MRGDTDVTSEQPGTHGPADTMPTVSQCVEHDPLEVVLILTRSGECGLELVHATAVHAFGGLGTLGGIAGRQEVLTKVCVRLFGWTDELPKSFDFSPERGHVVVETLS